MLEELGVTYDASVFPCPAYWSAGEGGGDRPHLVARAEEPLDRRHAERPPRPDAPVSLGPPVLEARRRRARDPGASDAGLRLPFIGTSVTPAGPERARWWLAKMCVGEPLVNLELHGIDVLDADDGLDALRPHQPDVRVPHARKVAARSRPPVTSSRRPATRSSRCEAAATFGAS